MYCHPHVAYPKGVLLTGSRMECMGGTTMELASMSPVKNVSDE